MTKEVQVLKDEIFDIASRILGALNSPVRLRIIQVLSNGPKSVEEIAIMLDQKVGNTSQHLQKMSRESLVYSKKDGVKRVYQIKNQEV